MRLLRGDSRFTWVADFVLIFVLAGVLVWPLAMLKYSDKWASIESTFISDARFLKDHWPHPRWQPYWYLGTRFDYIYPPALRYGVAAILKVHPKVIPPKAYHLYVAFLYALGIAGVYLLARAGSGSRGAAWLGAIGVATVSPSFLWIADMRQDSFNSFYEPQRLGVLHRYGEGPHMSAVAILGFAVAFTIFALKSGSRRWLAAAAVASALVVSHNFYGATALAMLFPVVLWSYWITYQKHAMFGRALAIVALAYGLTAFWLVPSYLHVTLENMRFVSERGNRWSLWLVIVLTIVYLKATEKWAKGRPERAYAVFLIGAVPLFFLNVIGNYYLGFRVIGEPLRMVPELDLMVLLGVFEITRRIWSWDGSKRARILRKSVAVAMVVACLWHGRKYVVRAWKPFVKGEAVTERLEFQITDWLAKNMPDSRAYTTGTVRFWYNAWYDLAQVGGGSEQGLLNPIGMPATWQLGMSEDGEQGVVWMQALGADVAIVHDKESTEEYKDITHPRKWNGLLPAVYNDGKGNYIYKVPRRYPGLARVVDASKLDALPESPYEPSIEHLRALVALLEQGPDAPTETRWNGTDELRIKAKVAAGQTVFVQVSYNSPFRAYSNGNELPVRKTQLGFLRIDAPPGEHEIALVFTLPLENAIGRGVTVLSLAVLAMMIAPRRKRV